MSGRDELEVLRAGPDIHLGNSLDSVLHLWIPGRRVRGAVPCSCDFSRMLRIPKHSVFTLWHRTVAAPSPLRLNAGS